MTSLVLTLALTFAVPARAATTLDASVDHDIVQPGETIELRLRQLGDGPAEAPDLAPLAQDFDVLDTSQSHRISIVNGVREVSTDWVVTIAPRTTGTLTIPALGAGGAVSEPITLRVVEATADTADAQKPDLFVETSVDQGSPFVQGEVRYTVRVYDAIGIREGTLTEPAADHLGVRPLGEGRAYDEMVGGRRYRVHEREYALVPQASGAVTVPPVTLEATVPDARGGPRTGFGGGSLIEEFFGDDALFDRFFDRGRQVRVRSNPVTLTVQARPDAAGDGWFLPARRVELARERDTTRTVRVGEPIEQTIVLRALGASAEQLPELDVPAADGTKQYSDAPETRTVPTADGTVAERRQTWTLMPSKAGTLTLPAVEVRWWDVEARAARTATLAAETVEVLPASGAAAQAEPAPDAAAAAFEPPTNAADETTDASESVDVPAPWWLAGGAALLLAAGVYLVARRRGPASAPAIAAQASTRALTGAIEDACRRHDTRAARAALFAWARATSADAPPTTTGEIARRMASSGMAEALAELDAALYGRETTVWRGDTLWQAFRASERARPSAEAAPREVLPGLYPPNRAA
jgi:hypothetical protein